MEVSAGDFASAAEEFGACSSQECKDLLCFEDVGAVAEDDGAAVAENALGVTKEKAEETGVKDGLQQGTERGTAKLGFGTAKRHLTGLRDIVAVCRKRSELKEV